MDPVVLISIIVSVIGTGSAASALILAPRTSRKIRAEAQNLDTNSFKILQDTTMNVIGTLNKEVDRQAAKILGLETDLAACRGGKI